jgi:hypothetical protein
VEKIDERAHALMMRTLSLSQSPRFRCRLLARSPDKKQGLCRTR